jgi:hypothetical protein
LHVQRPAERAGATRLTGCTSIPLDRPPHTARPAAAQGKADGVYPAGTPDMYAPLVDVVKVSSLKVRVIPAYLPSDSTALFTAVATLMTYLQCRSGTATAVPCPEGTLFSPTDLVCVPAYIATPGNSTDAPAGCTKQSCACTGRANGIYTDPTGSNQGLFCVFQQAAVLQVGAPACLCAEWWNLGVCKPICLWTFACCVGFSAAAFRCTRPGA